MDYSKGDENFNRQVLLSLISENTKTIAGVIFDNSDSKNSEKNIKLVKRAINYNFFLENGSEFFSDFKNYLSERCLFNYYIFQNDVLSNIFKYYTKHFNNFLSMCHMIESDYYSCIEKENFAFGLVDFQRLVAPRSNLDYCLCTCNKVPSPTAEFKNALDKNTKIEVLLKNCFDALNLYNKQKPNNTTNITDFVSTLNFGKYDKEFKEYVLSHRAKIEEDYAKLFNNEIDEDCLSILSKFLEKFDKKGEKDATQDNDNNLETIPEEIAKSIIDNHKFEKKETEKSPVLKQKDLVVVKQIKTKQGMDNLVKDSKGNVYEEKTGQGYLFPPEEIERDRF